MLHGEIMDFEDRGTEFRPEDIQYVHAAWVLQTLEAAVSPSPSQGFPQRNGLNHHEFNVNLWISTRLDSRLRRTPDRTFTGLSPCFASSLKGFRRKTGRSIGFKFATISIGRICC
ncbi:unnamed protein product [Sphagnum jensenii]|uniref:Uncharacterized protein n=1 Tax=Sphagnum jensenii TaxID=128206 RepID=A0ABP0WCU1_9BRYO